MNFQFESIDALLAASNNISLVMQARLFNKPLDQKQRSQLLGDALAVLGRKAKEIGPAACELAVAMAHELSK